MIQTTLDLGANTPESVGLTICEEQPQIRLENFGAAALSDSELLALMLQNGARSGDTLTLARQMIIEAGSLAGLTSWQPADFRRLRGVGPAKGQQLVAMIEIARRIMKGPAQETPIFSSAEAAAVYFRPIIAGLEVEKFWVLCLNRKNRLKKLVEITSGTATSTLVAPREVFRAALREGSTAILCAHNHPSGDPSPSAADVRVTRQLREAAATVEIDLLDHVILGRPTADPAAVGHYSFRAAGLL